MNTPRLATSFLMLLLASCCAGANELPWGLYAMSWDGAGPTTRRADADGEVVLGKRLSHELRDASLVSIQNDNAQFRVSLVADHVPAGADGQMAVIVAGLCIPVSSHGERAPDGSIAVGGMLAGEAAAAKFAEALHIKPRLREHPGHQLVVSVAPEKPTYRPRERVTLVMTIRNVGSTTVRFFDGGRQRGPRNNQFGFTAFRNHGHGRAVPDTGDPTNFGGIMGQQMLAPGQAFTKSVDLSKWFEFDTAESYLVTAMYQLQLHRNGFGDVLWDEVAAASCLVRVTEPPPTTTPAQSPPRS